METKIKTERLRIGGMTCVNCQHKIEKKLRGTKGVKTADVSYNAGTASVTYDADVISLQDISAVIQKLDYTVIIDSEPPKPEIDRIIGLLVIIAALFILLERFGLLNMLAPGQLADETMGYGMLFMIGLMTSVHCVAMCGGINLSQCIPRPRPGESETASGRASALIPAFLYNLGRVVSYTAVGFAVGALGSTVTFSNTTQGVLKLFAGVFMIIMGINMLGIFPWLRRLNPRMPKIIAQKINNEKSQNKSPLIVGLLNGFMPCGPLQAMQIYALSTGNPFTGALSMFIFSLGTVPLMFGLGAVSSAIGKRFTGKVMTAGSVLVVVLGLSMLSQGFSLSGFTGNVFKKTSGSAGGTQNNSGIAMEDAIAGDFQLINSKLSARGGYPAITVQAGTPVKWIIDAPKGSINGCNNRMIISEYGIEHSLKQGENVIEFTPDKTGTFYYYCWMGMVRSTITVVEADAETSEK